jgi:hypothetical protein
VEEAPSRSRHLRDSAWHLIYRHAEPERRLSQAASVIALYFKDLCGVDMSPP